MNHTTSPARRVLAQVVMALLLMAAATPVAAQTPSPEYTLYPPNLHLVAGQTSSVPLSVRDRNGSPVPGAVTFIGFDATLISVSASGFVTALRAEGPAEIGTWVTALIGAERVGSRAVVRVLSTARPEPFAFVTRANTTLYYPTTIAGENLAALVDRYQIPDVDEYAYLAQRRLMDTLPHGGARQVFEVDFGENEQQRVCGISGNPTRIGWNIQGTVWQNCFMAPFFSPRSPQWFVWHHELAHEFTGFSQSFARGLGEVTLPYVESMASALTIAQMEAMLQAPAQYPMGADAVVSLRQQLTQNVDIFATKLRSWLDQGAPFSQLDRDIVDGLFMLYKNQRPDFAPRFFLPLQPRYYPQLSGIFDQMGPADHHTIFAALMSAAAGQNLGTVFAGTYHYPLNPPLFFAALAAFNQILNALGPPAAPTGLVGVAVGNAVSLTWVPPASGGPPASYVLEAGSGPGLSNLVSLPTGNTNAIFTAGGVADGLYYVRVRATNALGTSTTSNEVQLRVGYAPPGQPTGLTATATGSTVQLSWNAPSTGDVPTTYVIEAGSETGLSNIARLSTGTTATSFATSGVPTGTYYIRVRAGNPGGQSPASNEAVLSVGCPAPPGAPGNLRITLNSGGRVGLAWDAASGNPGTYLLRAGRTPGATDVGSFDLGAQTAFSATGVPSGTYHLRVVARSACGTGAASNELQLVVVP
jgi:hypothetical protein